MGRGPHERDVEETANTASIPWHAAWRPRRVGGMRDESSKGALSMATAAASKHLSSSPPSGSPKGVAAAVNRWRDARYQAFALMRLTFTVAPIAFGIDKFFNVMVDWPNYLAPWINDIARAVARTSCTSSAESRSSPV